VSIFRKALDRIRKNKEPEGRTKTSELSEGDFDASEIELLNEIEQEILGNREYSEEVGQLSVGSLAPEEQDATHSGYETLSDEDPSPPVDSFDAAEALDTAGEYSEIAEPDFSSDESGKTCEEDDDEDECELEEFDEEDFLFDPTDGIEIYPDEDSPRFVDRYRRARQVAEMLGNEYDWTENEVRTLTTIFDVYGWNSAKRAIVPLLEIGVSEAELRLAFKLRLWWMHEHAYEFGSAYSTNISWLLAYKIVKSFGKIPDFEEIVDFVSRAFIKWQDDSEVRETYSNTIQKYLDALSLYADTKTFCAPGLDWGDGYRSDGCELFEDEKVVRDSKIEQFITENF